MPKNWNPFLEIVDFERFQHPSVVGTSLIHENETSIYVLLYSVSTIKVCCIKQDGNGLKDALIRRCPAKIDLGPVYNVDPQRRKAYTGQKLQKSFPGISIETLS